MNLSKQKWFNVVGIIAIIIVILVIKIINFANKRSETSDWASNISQTPNQTFNRPLSDLKPKAIINTANRANLSTLIKAQTERRTIDVDGTKREYIFHQPAHGSNESNFNLVLVFHGGGSTASQIQKSTSWDEISDKNGFIVVYPEGIDKNWNDNRISQSLNGAKLGDDIGFASKMIDELISQDKVNPQKVYVTGVSNGGFMSFKLACDLRDKISAIGVIVASVPSNYAQTCKPSKGISIIWFNGTADPLVPWEGGEIVSKTFGGSLSRGAVLSAQDSINFWKVINNCVSDSQNTDLPNFNKLDGSTVTRQYYDSNTGYPIDFYKITGGGHSWPGGPQYFPKLIIGNVNKDIDSLQLTWEFFSKH